MKRPKNSPNDRPPDWLHTAPKGMWYETRRAKDKPFLARWRIPGGQKDGRAFASEKERAEFAAQWIAQRKEFGRAAVFADAKQLEVWAEFARIVGDVPPLVVAREWRELKGAGATTSALTVAEAVTKYLAFRREGKLSDDTWRHFDKHLRVRFAERFAKVRLRDVTDEMISEWLRELKHPRTGEPMEAVTRRHHRKDVNTFFDYCARVKRWIPHNPCDGVAVPAVIDKDVRLLSVAEGRRLFAAAESRRVAGRLALEAFGFLRASKAGRLQVAEVSFERRGLRLRGIGTKSEKTRFRQGQPDNLWAWLARAPDETWEMQWWEYRNEKAVAFAAAGITEGSENRLRKTCISAHLAAFRNPALTSYLAQHSSTAMTEKYEGLMDEADALAWWGIGPAFILP
jgi:hypothetical protein